MASTLEGTAIGKLRSICETCATEKTNKYVFGQPFEARRLNQQQTVGARYGTLALSQMLSRGLMSVYPNALDGAKWKWVEFIPRITQSRGTGGLDKFTCGRDPQAYKHKVTTKIQSTERFYIHADQCNLNYIGSVLQNASNDLGINFINGSDSVISASQARELSTLLMLNDFRSMARAIDGNSLLGNFNRKAASKEAGITADTSLYAHWDGAIKSSLIQGGATRYAAVRITLPAVGAGAYIARLPNGNYRVAADVTSLVTELNAACVDVTNEKLFSASASGQDVTIVACDPCKSAYGWPFGVEIFYAADGTINSCDIPLEATILEVEMDHAESPILLEYTALSTSNWHDYWKDVLIRWEFKLSNLFEGGIPLNIGTPYIGIDPNLMIYQKFSFYDEYVKADNSIQRMDRLAQLLPRFESLESLKGTGLWYMTVPENLIYLTNMNTNGEGSGLAETELWYDRECKLIKSDMEMLGNTLVVDYNLFMTNAKNSGFSQKLHEAYEPQNVPHIMYTTRTDVKYVGRQVALRAGASVEATQNGDTTWTVTLTDKSTFSTDDEITGWNWEFMDADGNLVGAAVTTQNAEVSLTDAQYQTIQFVKLTVTTTSTATEDTYFPKCDFEII